MDPTETLRQIIEALIEGDSWNEAPELAEALNGWLDSGGFLPDISDNQKLFLLRFFLNRLEGRVT